MKRLDDAWWVHTDQIWWIARVDDDHDLWVDIYRSESEARKAIADDEETHKMVLVGSEVVRGCTIVNTLEYFT